MYILIGDVVLRWVIHRESVMFLSMIYVSIHSMHSVMDPGDVWIDGGHISHCAEIVSVGRISMRRRSFSWINSTVYWYHMHSVSCVICILLYHNWMNFCVM